MTRTLARILLIAVVALCAAVPAWPNHTHSPQPNASPTTDGHAHHHQPAPQATGVMEETAPSPEMATHRVPDTPERLRLKEEFRARYRSAGADSDAASADVRRAVFDEFLPRLDAQGMLDVLESIHPLCHSQAHELGRAVYASIGDLDAAVAQCGTRCTSACTHGVLEEAFGTVDLATLRPRLATLCTRGALGETRRIGTCAHGIGHALMTITGRDVGQSLAACGGFEIPALTDFCASGVFMELFEHPLPADAGQLYPCDTYTTHPAACFRYLTMRLMRRPSLGGDGAVLALCRSLSRPQRLGCVHGFGFGLIPRLQRDPRWIESCDLSDPDEQTMCIEGAMEALGGLAPERARMVCARLTGPAAEVCHAAATSGLYRLDKPSMPLYFGPPAPSGS